VRRWLKAPAGVLVVALLVPLLNMIPTIDGYEHQGPDEVFLGFRNMAGDHYQYGSMIRQTAGQGRFFYDDLLTNEAQRGSYVFLYFYLVGTLMRVTGWSLVAVWELLRVVIGFAFLLATWRYLEAFFENRRTRLTAFAFVALGGGFSWIAGLVPDSAYTRSGFPGVTDPVNYPWNWSMFGAMLVPLWVLPALLLVVAGVVFAGKKESPAWGRWLAGLTLGPAIWFTHPHSGNVAYLTFGLFAIFPIFEAIWRIERIAGEELRSAFARSFPFVFSFIVVAAYLSWAGQDPVFAAVSKTAVLWSPTYSVFLYAITYGLLLPLGIFGIRFCGSLPERPRRFLLAWASAAFVLSVNPWWAGSKHQFMLFPPLAIFAAHGLAELRARSRLALKASSGWAGALLGSLIFLNAPLSLLREMPKTATVNECYVTKSDYEAMKFLDTQPQGTVLASPKIGNIIPWLSGKRVYVGHWLLTSNAGTKQKQILGFFDASVPAENKQAFLVSNDIRYVYYGPTEAGLGAIDPGLSLALVYDAGGVRIYRTL